MNKNKWSMDMTVKFIQLYKDKECLWNTNSPRYKNRNFRNAALEDIKAKMNIDGFGKEEIKTKIRILRSTYYQEKRKIINSQSAGSEDIYRPNVKWYDDMDEIITKPGNSSEFLDNLNTEAEHEDVDFNMESDFFSDPRELEKSPNELKPKKKSKVDEVASIVKVLQEMKNNPELNEFEIFGSSVAAQLKKLSETQAAIAQERIQSILTTCRLNDIRENSTGNIRSEVKVDIDDREPLKL